eukprot:TRINITY_DN9795_c0_g1_i6.p1 TRINITY_DN9795_c0_g1~~TRINITY_DN9795_c0_g1_i6.p1  ORF type:complete len:244 (-),score=48.75 TRINITY_DN9795_c0_g1_i6:608-1339(-)
MLLLILLFLAIAQGYPAHCPKYVCSDKLSASNACAKTDFTKDSVEIFLRTCSNGHVCDVSPSNFETTLCSPYYTITKLYPGEYCTNSTECYSSTCENNKCKGHKENEKCTTDFDCNPGLYCLNTECVKAVANDVCTKEQKCAANCVKNGDRCDLVGSVDNGKRSLVPGACRSLYIDEEGKCSEGPKLDPKQKNKANPEYCSYTTGGKIKQEVPVCGMNKDSHSYCNPGLGDVDINLVLPIIIK